MFAPLSLLALAGLTVIDGDTVRLGDERIRLIGVDTPEMRARCPAERESALAARDRLAGMLDEGDVQIERHGVGRWGRTLAVIQVDGRDVSLQLIAEGLGRPYDGGRRDGWCG